MQGDWLLPSVTGMVDYNCRMVILFRTTPGLKNSACENKVYLAGAEASFVLNMKNERSSVSVKRVILESNARHSSKS